MLTNEINIRDPFLLVHNGKYYLYGTRGSECWDTCTGLDVYIGTDLQNWSEPIVCFQKPADFWADKNYWAPEVYQYKGSFYMFVSFKKDGLCRGTAVLKADAPEGPFLPWSDGCVTPRDWECLDGTLYVDDGTPYMIFCHEWLQCGDGEIHRMKLTDDLKAAAGKPEILFSATAFDNVYNFGTAQKPGYCTDGPFLYRDGDRLLCLWSSFTAEDGYCQLVAVSDNGHITGNFRQLSPIFKDDGGHGMLFTSLEGRLFLLLHRPNGTPFVSHKQPVFPPYEHPVFIPIEQLPKE